MDFAAFFAELTSLLSFDWWRTNWDELAKITMINIVLSGDNAIVIGLAASRVPQEIRSKVIFGGITAAVVLRIMFALVASKLLLVVGLTLAGGLLLLWVCWNMYRQLDSEPEHSLEDVESGAGVAAGSDMGFWPAITQITIADLSMSLDNVLAVAGAARGSTLVLVIGLLVGIILMAVASHALARLLVKYHWIAWIGLAMIVWVALEMIYQGSHEVTCKVYDFGCSDTIIDGIKHRLGLGPRT